jgi:hypothetical protein
MDEVVSFLANSVVCEGFDETEVTKLAKICKVIPFQSGEVIVVDDARERDLYLIFCWRKCRGDQKDCSWAGCWRTGLYRWREAIYLGGGDRRRRGHSARLG